MAESESITSDERARLSLSLSLRLKDLLGPVTRVMKKKKTREPRPPLHPVSHLAIQYILSRNASAKGQLKCLYGDASSVIFGQTLVSLSLRLEDLLGPVTRVKKKRKDLGSKRVEDL